MFWHVLLYVIMVFFLHVCFFVGCINNCNYIFIPNCNTRNNLCEYFEPNVDQFLKESFAVVAQPHRCNGESAQYALGWSLCLGNWSSFRLGNLYSMKFTFNKIYEHEIYESENWSRYPKIVRMF